MPKYTYAGQWMRLNKEQSLASHSMHENILNIFQQYSNY